MEHKETEKEQEVSLTGKWYVSVTNNGINFFLKGTTWAFSIERADIFETRELAHAALQVARQFMNAKLFKQARFTQL